jgi:hypothetical protein
MNNQNIIFNYGNCDSCGKTLTECEFSKRTFICDICNDEWSSRSHNIFNPNVEQVGNVDQDVWWFNPIDTPSFFNYNYEYPEEDYYESDHEEEEQDYDW